jgi:DNA-directed RNA polymerase subunit RPC12/RpoP
MIEWKEIEPKPKATFRTESSPDDCPNCGGEIFLSKIPCPDHRRGCLVMHYGYRCDDCGKIFEKIDK